MNAPHTGPKPDQRPNGGKKNKRRRRRGKGGGASGGNAANPQQQQQQQLQQPRPSNQSPRKPEHKKNGPGHHQQHQNQQRRDRSPEQSEKSNSPGTPELQQLQKKKKKQKPVPAYPTTHVRKRYDVMFFDSLAEAHAAIERLRDKAAETDQLNIIIRAEANMDDPVLASIPKTKVFAGTAWALIHDRRVADGWYNEAR